ncbi:MAG TPA: PIN domain-containing protein [Chryseolinea sp.]|nr:PIN domain-containing protein [Chryseolinea sp.]HPM30997.1 PIN domain-containing protein [Chryseolinea sp.]
MIVVDTSIWIDFFRRVDPILEEKLIEYLEHRQIYGVSVVFGELLQGVRDEQEEKLILEYWKNLPKANEDSLFIDAGRLSFKHKLYSKGVGLIDCFIIAAAKSSQSEIWTHDKKLLQAYQLVR